MRYQYRCDKCDTTEIINKAMSESSKTEHCSTCKGVLKRDYTSPSIGTGDGFKS